MKRFEWRLQRVLDIKGKAEQLKRGELLQLGEQLAEAHALLRAQERLLQVTLERVVHLDVSVRMHEQALALKQSAYNDQRIQRWRAKITQLESQREAKKAEVLALRREREGLERLRTQALAEYTVEYDREVQKETDDRVSTRFARERQIPAASHPLEAPVSACKGEAQ